MLLANLWVFLIWHRSVCLALERCRRHSNTIPILMEMKYKKFSRYVAFCVLNRFRSPKRRNIPRHSSRLISNSFGHIFHSTLLCSLKSLDVPLLNCFQLSIYIENVVKGQLRVTRYGDRYSVNFCARYNLKNVEFVADAKWCEGRWYYQPLVLLNRREL